MTNNDILRRIRFLFDFSDLKMIEVFKTMKKPDEEIQSSIKMAESGNLYSISNVFKGLIFNYLVPLSIVGLLVAAAMQKNKPDTK